MNLTKPETTNLAVTKFFANIVFYRFSAQSVFFAKMMINKAVVVKKGEELE